jgi:hypothetical protein
MWPLAEVLYEIAHEEVRLCRDVGVAKRKKK